jgi:hypothetical protein
MLDYNLVYLNRDRATHDVQSKSHIFLWKGAIVFMIFLVMMSNFYFIDFTYAILYFAFLFLFYDDGCVLRSDACYDDR